MPRLRAAQVESTGPQKKVPHSSLSLEFLGAAAVGLSGLQLRQSTPMGEPQSASRNFRILLADG